MGWSRLEKITWVIFTLCGFAIGYNMSAHYEDIPLWLALVSCFFLGMAYSSYLTIKKMEKMLEELEGD
ncbi:MAG: hypothetical protein NDF55_10520 [archaeon GB-1867-005]|nr:hypothetical protein [Candidatus Culexmicrobium cathedralense]